MSVLLAGSVAGSSDSALGFLTDQPHEAYVIRIFKHLIALGVQLGDRSVRREPAANWMRQVTPLAAG